MNLCLDDKSSDGVVAKITAKAKEADNESSFRPTSAVLIYPQQPSDGRNFVVTVVIIVVAVVIVIAAITMAYLCCDWRKPKEPEVQVVQQMMPGIMLNMVDPAPPPPAAHATPAAGNSLWPLAVLAPYVLPIVPIATLFCKLICCAGAGYLEEGPASANEQRKIVPGMGNVMPAEPPPSYETIPGARPAPVGLEKT